MTPEVEAGTRRARPSRRPYLVAALVTVVLVAVALLLPWLLRRGGDIGRPFPLREAVPVEIDPPAERMVWAKGDFPPQGLRCEFATDRLTSGVSVRWMLFEPVEAHADGARWRGVLTLGADQPGTYDVTCTTTGAGGSAEPTLSIGTPPRFIGERARILTTLASGALILAGLLAGGLIAGRAAWRRRR